MKPGSELDALIAEKVMGWTVNRCDGGHWRTVGPTGRERGILIGRECCADKYDGGFCPSTDIADAWEVVKKLQADHSQVRVVGYNVDEWFCDVAPFLKSPPYPDQVTGGGLTASHAICLAALKAVGA